MVQLIVQHRTRGKQPKGENQHDTTRRQKATMKLSHPAMPQ